MKILAVLMLKVLYWMAVAYLPIAIIGLGDELRAVLGCPASGDCRGRGELAMDELEFLGIYAAVFLWPLSIVRSWQAGLRAAKALHASSKH